MKEVAIMTLPDTVYIFELGTLDHVGTIVYPCDNDIKAALRRWIFSQAKQRTGVSFSFDESRDYMDYIEPIDLTWN